MIPSSSPYIRNYLDNKAELPGLGNTIRIVVENKTGDIYDKVNAIAGLPTEREGATEGQNLVAWLWTFGVACIRRALIVAACVLASALAA